MNPAQHINQTSFDVEWYTPPEIIEAARTVMGGIDLDPASCAKANETVKALQYYTKAVSGLTNRWWGRVWMNHPFGAEEYPCKPNCTKKRCKERGYCVSTYQPGNKDWINALVTKYRSEEIEQACCITFASTDTEWFQPLLDFPMCFLAPRTNYLDQNGNVVKGVTKGSVVTYLGPSVETFACTFAPMGRIMVPASEYLGRL